MGQMVGRLKQKLGSILIFRRYNGQPAELSQRDIVLFLKTKDLCVKLQGFSLVIDENACDVESHVLFSSALIASGGKPDNFRKIA